MSHKTIVKIAVVMLIVFGITVVVYPLLYKPTADKAAPVTAEDVP